ncbi:hypothetical protein ACHAPF_005250 [Botrytis cinerea]
MTAPYTTSPHITKVPLETISKLSPFSGLILSIILILYFLIRYYLFEPLLLPYLYGSTFTTMPSGSALRCGFINHHIAGLTKLLILILAAYPFISVTFLTSSLHSPFAPGSETTMGDVLIIAAQMLIAMYIFELLYRPKISPVSVGHHVGTILIGQSAIAISLDLVKERDATIEFILCTEPSTSSPNSSPTSPSFSTAATPPPTPSSAKSSASQPSPPSPAQLAKQSSPCFSLGVCGIDGH